MNGPELTPGKPQRCDVVQTAEGTTQITVSGDWLQNSDVEVLKRTLSNFVSWSGPLVVDISEAGQLSLPARAVLDRFR